MLAEIIAIGSELTTGAKLDTNSQWLSLRLGELGIAVGYHTTVADDLPAMKEVFRAALERVDLILITGGLGPTLDDLTRDAVADLLQLDLQLHPSSLERIEKFFRGRGRTMPERNRVQAMFPQGAEPLLNPIGTAPGFWMTVSRPGRGACLLAAMPGVPSEMFRMFDEQVRPRLPGGQRVIRRARINCFGIGESATEELLGDLTSRGHDPEIGITAHNATITLRINAEGATAGECDEKIAVASRQIRDRLGEYVFGVEDEELEHVVVREMVSRGLTFATLECGTTGLLAGKVAHAPGAAAGSRGGWVVSVMTGLPADEAVRVLDLTQADCVLVVGAETIDVDAEGHAVSRMPVGLIGKDGTRQIQDLNWTGNPAISRSRAAKTALDLLRRYLLALPIQESTIPKEP